jgi:hypothetical protein
MHKSKLAGFIESPSGQRFCVVRATSKDFDAKASEWPQVLFCHQLATHLT